MKEIIDECMKDVSMFILYYRTIQVLDSRWELNKNVDKSIYKSKEEYIEVEFRHTIQSYLINKKISE